MNRLELILLLKRIFYISESQCNNRIFTNINLLGFSIKIRNKDKELDLLNQQLMNLYGIVNNLSQQVALDRVLLEQSVAVKTVPPAKGNLRTVQLIKTKLLELISIIFEEKQITYWLDYGTLIGAIRHDGFIPWDDDIDVSLLKTDYLKLSQVFEKLCSLNSNFTFTYNFDTHVIQRLFYKNFCVDFFPFEYLNYECRNISEKTNYEKKWYKIHNEFFKKYSCEDIKNNKIKYVEIRDNIEQIKKDIFDTKYNEGESSEQIIYSPEYTFVMDKCAVLNAKNILPATKHKFEHLVLPIPNDPIEHLFEHGIYGEKGSVMNFPKLSDSGFHHTQANYENSDIDFNGIYQELSDFVEQYKTMEV